MSGTNGIGSARVVTPLVPVGPASETAAVAVSIVGAVPMYQQGLATVLEQAGYTVEATEDIRTWVGSRRRPAIVTTLEGLERSGGAAALRATCPGLVVVALLEDECTEAYQTGLAAGVDGAVHLDAALEDVLSVFVAALGEQTLIPAPVARELAEESTVSPDAPSLCAQDAALLQALATGDTVAQIAITVGFSDRETYRRLRKLYDELGVDNRSEALVYAARSGLL